ncbi:MAG: riboflavin synthase [Clostridia bacterium]|nr:riboflavin synthase [Clostridia bacterium]NCC76011.1 riboflavin synthase [Clostridia bacterium]
MFTGIIEEMGTVLSIHRSGEKIRFTIQARKVLGDTRRGDSIAVNGICLTAVDLTGSTFAADVMPETLRRSSLSEMRPGSPVNLERALRLSDRLGGHIVSGHIDGTGTIQSRTPEHNAILLKIQAAPELLKYIVAKGSVALDGVSLTVAAVSSNDFTVSIIPHSASETIIGHYQPGDLVNIECDVIGKYVEKLLGLTGSSSSPEQPSEHKPASRLSFEFLREHGF